MQSKLPDYILRKKFDYHFIFTDSEVYYNEYFNNCIQDFSKKINGFEIIIEIMNFKAIKEYSKYGIIRIPNSDSLSKLAEIPLIADQSVEDLLGDYYIYDNSGEWEFYASLIDETVVFGCNLSVLNIFIDTFQPYKTMTIETKLKDIYGNCRSKEERKKFINSLCDNYNFIS